MAGVTIAFSLGLGTPTSVTGRAFTSQIGLGQHIPIGGIAVVGAPNFSQIIEADLTCPLPAVSARDDYGGGTLPMPEVTGELPYLLHLPALEISARDDYGGGTLPMPVVDGVIDWSPYGSGTLPMPEVLAGMDGGGGSLPALEISARDDYGGGTLPMPVVDGILIVPNVFTGGGTLPALQVVNVGTAEMVLPAPTLDAECLAGSAGSIAVSASAQVFGVLLTGAVANGGGTLPRPSVSALILSQGFCAVDATLPMPTVSAVCETQYASMSLPMPIVEARMAETARADLVLPMPLVQAVGHPGRTMEGGGELPMMVAEAYAGIEAGGTLPMPTVAGVLLPGALAVCDPDTLILPMPVIEAWGTSPVVITGGGTLPAANVVAVCVSGNSATGQAILPRLALAAEGMTGTVCSADIRLPMFSMNAEAHGAYIGTAELTCPMLVLSATGISRRALTYSALSMNTETGAVAEYTNFPFHSFGRLGNAYLGATADGIFALAGDDDDGTAITAYLRSGFGDFKGVGLDNEQLKRVTDAYVGYRSSGDLELVVRLDGEQAEYTYPLAAHSLAGGLTRQRAQLGRGMKSRYWQFELRNVAGADFHLDEIGLLVKPISRKTAA